MSRVVPQGNPKALLLIQMLMWNQFFEKIYYINLDKRADRRKAVEEEFRINGIEAERFKACEGDNPHLAFNKSQHAVLSLCKEFKTSLVLEDDVEFKNWNHLGAALAELPEDWDLVSFGANINGTQLTKFSPHLFRLRNSFTTHAIGYSAKMAKWIVENFPYHDDKYEREGLIIFDEWLRVNVLEQFNCFLIYPMIAWQRPSRSDIWHNDADYTRCFIDGNALLSKL